jgi:hypothetical protein
VKISEQQRKTTLEDRNKNAEKTPKKRREISKKDGETPENRRKGDG